MKLTKKIEKEIINLMEDYWNQYLTGKIEPWSKYLVDNYRNIGGTEEEIWNSKKEILDYTYGVIDQMKDKVQLRNKTIQIIPYAPYFMVHELLDMYVIIDGDWSFYGKFRLSSLIQKFGIDWKVLHQHGSFPDSKTQKGEAFAVDALKAENLKLQKAVQKRTIELEQRNRELEVETALERIRAQAVAMKETSDLLDIVVTMRKEFIKLGHEAHYFWHMMWLPKTYEKAMTSGDGSKIGFVMTLPRHMHGDIPLIANWEKSKKPTIVYTFTTEESIDYVDKMVALGDFKNIDPQAPSHEDLKHIEGLTFIMARTTHGEIGYSLPGIVKNPPAEDLDILVKFASAFDLAHQRFLDLQKAEKQARETQIELALEKVRSQSMVMQKSEELGSVVDTLFEQFKILDLNFMTCWISLMDEGQNTLEYWVKHEGDEISPVKVHASDHDNFNKEIEAWKNNVEFINIPIPYKNAITALKEIFNIELKNKVGDFTFHLLNIRYLQGYLGIGSLQKANTETLDILKRFVIVFEQAYTRFLDLQKAEAQAREAQIEAALEKVRSRSLAMHKSEELNEVVSVIFEKLKELKIPATAVGIGIYIDGSKDLNSYVCGENEDGLVITNYRLPYFNNKISRALCNLREKQLDFFVGHYSKQVKNSFYKYVLENTPEFKHLPDDIKSMIFNSSSYTITMVAVNHAMFNINDFEGKVLSNDDVTIIKRFANVFDQSYTRFLDLQKAETQAREAQIEAALERVRAASMAMHASEELQSVIRVLYDQIKLLGLPIDSAQLCFIRPNNKDFYLRIASEDEVYFNEIRIPYTKHPLFDIFWHNSHQKRVSYSDSFNKKEKDAFFKYCFAQSDLKIISDQRKKVILDAPGMARINAVIDQITLTILNYQMAPYSEKDNALVLRFCEVFHQSYIRFIDLQKAEAQAREANIEAALERVRSHSMGMQSTDDFGAVTTEMFNQLRNLGEDLFATGIVFCDKHEGHVEQWHSIPNGGMLSPFIVPIDLDYIHQYRYDQWKKGEELFSIEIPSDFIEQHFEDIFNLPSAQVALKDLESRNAPMPAAPTWEIDYGASFKNGYILASSLQHFENIDILPRFANVFEQAYTRFLDLQKAEAQTKEAQIEASLERVRARAMAMHKSDDFSNSVETVFSELKQLGFNTLRCGIGIFNDNSNKVNIWSISSDSNDEKASLSGDEKLEGHPLLDKIYEAWTNQVDFSYTLKGKDLDNYYKVVSDSNFPISGPEKNELSTQYYHAVVFPAGGLYAFSTSEFNEDEKQLMKRFGEVFHLSFTRHLDLKQAEAQAREAQIEHALEKVRSRTMAMQHSQELPEAANVLFTEVQNLGIPAWSCGYNILSKDKKSSTCIMSSQGEIQSPFILPLTEHISLKPWHKAILNNEQFFVYEQGGKDLEEHYNYMESLPELKETFQQFKVADIPLPTFQVNHLAKFTSGFLLFITYERAPEAHGIFQRFSKVFEQTYTRFLDLQKAEEQSRTAQINLAVERVRAKALAMHKSEEIIEVVAKLKDEVMGLDIPDVVAATIFLNEGKDKVRMWDLSSLEHDDNYLEVPFDITFEIKKTDPHLYVKRVWENPENFFVEKQDEKDFKRLMQWLRELHKNEIADEVEDFIEKTQLKRLYHSAIKLNSGKLVIDQLTHPSDEMETILTKMGAAFDLAYKRFEDLKNAEAQTREAQIEAAIERVRSKSMAMHKSSELRDVVNTLHIEFRSLNLNFHVAAIQLFLEETKDLDLWIATDDGLYSDIIHWPYVDLRVLNEMNKARKSKTNIEILLSKPETKEFLDEYFKLDGTPQERKATLSSVELVDIIAFYQANTGIFIIRYSEGTYTEEEKNITQRFSKVFEQSYTRFLDLQKAEEQAREAQIETSLERVRSRTLAMQTSEELAETSVIVFKQLLELGIAPNRLFIGIVKSDNDTIEAWTTNEDGSKLAIHFSPQASKNKSIKKMLDGWKQQKKSIIIDMKGKELESYFRYLNEDMKIPFIDGLKQKRRVQTIAYFSGGLIGMAAAEEQPDDTIHLLERFAAVFNLTYTRFKDLKIAEANAEKAKQDLIKLQAAKKSAEEALTELQLTQNQLIQSEKMASLGELTAGIAHEIQNPLNFVNNFSEVSKELLDEMIEELENGDIEEVKAITDDVIQNLEKINHHGKRADGIVKGMLQHSRASGDKKEATNINALADEYLRLAYHGLRAKDKSFNAQLVTDFDKSITTVDVIPQDLGRVVLNLLTNAFYAVNEKKRSGLENYEPTVSISTKKVKNNIVIKVKDNGNGIPKKVLDKIFQPFFTTKPTGQGTGLGLSMSYDIVTKGHRGQLKVNTALNKGTEFIIELPV